MTRLVIPNIGERWVRRGVDREVIIVGIKHDLDRDKDFKSTIEYRYVSGLGGSGLWRRRMTPSQTIELTEFNRLFDRKVA